MCFRSPYLIIADPRHFHVIRESRLRPRDRRSVPPDDFDIPRTVFDFWCLAAYEDSGLADGSIFTYIYYIYGENRSAAHFRASRAPRR